jgi:hypothetical protein
MRGSRVHPADPTDMLSAFDRKNARVFAGERKHMGEVHPGAHCSACALIPVQIKTNKHCNTTYQRRGMVPCSQLVVCVECMLNVYRQRVIL